MKNFFLPLLALAILLSSCTPNNEVVLTVMTHDSFAVSEGVIATFEQENHVRLVFLKSGDAGAALNKAILSKDAPLADVFYGVDNTFLSRALTAGIFEQYASPLLEKISTEFQLDPKNRLLPVNYGDVCINYDIAWFANNGLSVPRSLEDLLKPEYQGLLVVEDPATSSVGMAFLLATVAHFSDPGYLDYWHSLRSNEVVVVEGWETAYYTNFSASSGRGAQPMVVSYGTSPAAEVIFASPPLTDAPTASIIGPDTCFRQVEFAGILKGTKNRSLAEKFMDFILGIQFQEDLPLQNFVFPVNQEARVPQVFLQYIQIPDQPAQLNPGAIAEGRDQWIEAWTEVVLH